MLSANLLLYRNTRGSQPKLHTTGSGHLGTSAWNASLLGNALQQKLWKAGWELWAPRPDLTYDSPSQTLFSPTQFRGSLRRGRACHPGEWPKQTPAFPLTSTRVPTAVSCGRRCQSAKAMTKRQSPPQPNTCKRKVPEPDADNKDARLRTGDAPGAVCKQQKPHF